MSYWANVYNVYVLLNNEKHCERKLKLKQTKKTNTKAKTKCHAIHKNAFIISNLFLADQEQKGDIHLERRMRQNYKAKAFNTPPLCIRPFYKRNIKCRTHSDAESSFLQTHIQWKVFFWELSPFSHILNTGIFPSALVSIIPERRTSTNSAQTKVCTKHLWKETVGCNLVSGNEYRCQAGEESIVILWRITEADTNKMHKTNVKRFW